MKFSEMPYTRPNVDQTVERYRQLAEKAKAAASGEELTRLFATHTQLDDAFSTAFRLAQIRHTLDTRDAFYDAENDFFDQAGPRVGNAQLAFYRAVLQSPHKAALAEAYAPILLDKMELAVSGASDAVLELMQQENALASRYQKLKASAQVEFQGKTCTLPELDPYKQSLDRATRKAAFAAEGSFYDENRAELEEIYTAMIENRNAQARALGYPSYVELSYKRMGRLGYGPKEVASFRDQVAKYVTPLAHQAMKAQFARVGIPDAKFYDTTVSFADGNPTPVGTADQLLAKAVQMYSELSPETARFIRFMAESELFDLVSRPGKATGGYCETIPAYGAPFVFSNFNGTSGDVDVLTHEAGHAFQAWVAAGQGMCQELASPSMESCEIHSMSMEFLTAPWHHLFFGGDERATAKYALAHAQEALTFLPYGCMVDEFQHIVYADPGLSAAQRDQVWLQLERKYRPWNDFGDLPFYGRGAGWQRQLHIYEAPFYYIDYCLAQMAALQFFAASLADRDDAWQRYLALVKKAGADTYAGLVRAAGFAVPFEQGAIQPVVQQVADWCAQKDRELA
ncbi:MAG TPA: M3 family oligoendopeptidase [Candidatus Fournierella merdigallinarum]|nr:M3 family oligoendopeptidase [Candidatus Fournierella merdigallinarum]